MDDGRGKRPYYNIALIGFMGTGKSTVGRLVANHLHYGFIDTDHLIELRAGKPITMIFKEEGEEAFRSYEREVVKEITRFRKMVISTGGGLGANADNIQSLKTHALVVCLWASAETIYERVKNQTHRPLLQMPDPLARIKELLAKRESFYKMADVLISTDARTPKDVAQQVIFQYKLARASAQKM